MFLESTKYWANGEVMSWFQKQGRCCLPIWPMVIMLHGPTLCQCSNPGGNWKSVLFPQLVQDRVNAKWLFRCILLKLRPCEVKQPRGHFRCIRWSPRSYRSMCNVYCEKRFSDVHVQHCALCNSEQCSGGLSHTGCFFDWSRPKSSQCWRIPWSVHCTPLF